VREALTTLKNLEHLTEEEQKELLRLLEKQDEEVSRIKAQSSFLDFMRAVWPDFIMGHHFKLIADAFDKIATGEKKRLIICMPPRHGKSKSSSVHLPAWYLGKYPNKKVIQASHTADLSVGFGREVRDLLTDPLFQKIFPGVSLKQDSKAAGHWHTHVGGEYFAIGTGGKVTGKGADLLIIDDPHSEQEAKLAEFQPEIYDQIYDWYTSGPRQRLQPNGAIVILMTRWSKRDLVGRILDAQNQKEGVDQWEVIELPCILPSGKQLWPEYWPMEELLALKAELPLNKWLSQYQQNPTSSEGSLIKAEWWQKWVKEKPPKCESIICAMDTAFTKNDRSDYTACTTWGVFKREDPNSGKEIPSLILLHAWRKKLAFPELKKATIDHYKEYEPDVMLIEARAAGLPLIYELRAMGVPVQDFTPTRGNDKISRVNAITDIFASSNVFAQSSPEGVFPRYVEEVVVECNDFPAGAHDDYVDTVSMALMRYRQGGWIGTNLDEKEDENLKKRRVIEYY
jgi:predicted phage terminase large subunit-like protein